MQFSCVYMTQCGREFWQTPNSSSQSEFLFHMRPRAPLWGLIKINSPFQHLCHLDRKPTGWRERRTQALPDCLVGWWWGCAQNRCPLLCQTCCISKPTFLSSIFLSVFFSLCTSNILNTTSIVLYEVGLVLRLRDCLISRTRSLSKGYVSQDVFSCVYEFQARAKTALFTSLFLQSWGMPRSPVAPWNKNTTEGKAGWALENGLNEVGGDSPWVSGPIKQEPRQPTVMEEAKADYA